MPSLVYRALLRLYPASFRSEYGAELLRTFQESVRDRGRFAAMLAAIADVIPNAALAHGRILLQDLRYAMRTIGRSRGFAATVVLVTAIGVGANTATFSVTDFVLLRPLPFPDPGALVRLCEGPRGGGGWGCMNELSPANYRDVASGSTAFTSWGAFTWTAVNLTGTGEPVRLGGTLVTAQVLPLLGVRPLLGRVFDSTAADRDAGSVVLGYGLWQTRFGGDPRIVGTTVRLDGTPRVVVGIMPRGFEFPAPGVQLWLPLGLREEDFLDRTDTYLHGVSRLRAGATVEQGRADLTRIFERLAQQYPETNRETGFSFFRLRDQVLPRYRLMLLALCGASLSLLLLTGANLANLLLARAAGRERELAVRAAMGAGRDRLVRQLLTESLVLAGIGGAAGILVATAAMPLFAHLVPTTLLLAAHPTLDLRVLAIAGILTALTGIGFGLLPAIRVSGRTGLAALREGARAGGGRRQRLRTVLVTAEVAISVSLLISSGFLIRAILRVQAVDPGFVAGGVLTLRTELPHPQYDDSVRRATFYQRVLTDVRALPGVEAAAYTSGIPMVLTGGIAAVEVPGAEVLPSRRAGVSWRLITPQYFRALGVPVKRGRDLEDSDRPGRPLVAVVSESFVQRYWPGRDPIGLTFKIRDQLRTVVGVVRHIKVRGLERTNEPQVYLPAAQENQNVGGLYFPKDLVVKAEGHGVDLVPLIREIIHRVDPEQPISDIRMMTDVVARETESRKAQLEILAALAGIALVLTAVGIHGLLAFLVAQRANEIGVRLALGAEPRRVARMIVGEAARWTAIGCVAGALIAYAAARAMSALLFGLGPGDPVTFGGGLAVVALVTLSGALVPALRAVRISPLLAMRAE